jgi:ParB family chromosome partitioning protein
LGLPNKRISGNLALAGYDDIFQASAFTADYSGERIVELPLRELYPPEFHPFQVNDDEAMDRLVKNVVQYGVREPGLARPLADGGYELLAGNRRKRACERAGLPTMPVIVREMDDDSAVIAMVDSNIEQREKLLFSEKAWAYRIKLEALNHRGSKSENPGQLSVEILCEQTGESKNTIFRLIRLTDLVPDLLDLVDTKRLAFGPAIELSYLTRTEQTSLAECMEKHLAKPTLKQALDLKKSSQEGGLTADAIEAVLGADVQQKPDNRAVIKQFRDYFPEHYTPEQMVNVIVDLLTKWKAEC